MTYAPAHHQVTEPDLPVHGVMEGSGAYNKHAMIPAAGAQSALPILGVAAQAVCPAGGEPILIADYGSSEGKNSLAPMRVVIASFRARYGPERPISVVHVDLPGNDFNTLFDVIEAAPERYRADDPFVFPAAIGRSFYSGVFPPESVHLGWSSYAAVWLSRVPAPIPDHIVALRSSDTVRGAYARQAATDWELFLSLRAAELRPGGRLVVVLPALDDAGSSGLGEFFDHAHAALRDLVDAGAIDAGELRRMALGIFPRGKRDLLAPFATAGTFEGLAVEHCAVEVLPDAAWTAYELTRNGQALAREHALFFRVVFIPTLASALDERRTADERHAFADDFTNALERHLVDAPGPLDRFVATIVLAKADPRDATTYPQESQ
jgi:hypothetical protein